MQVLLAIIILTIRGAFAAPGAPFAAYGPPSTLTGIEDFGSQPAPGPTTVPEIPSAQRPSNSVDREIPRVETPDAMFPASRPDEYPAPGPSQPVSSGFDDSSQELVLPSEQQPTSNPESSPSKSPAIILPPGTKLKVEDDRGQYSHGFSSPDGTEVQETGHLITTNGGWEYVIAKEGSYRYTSPEGVPITVRYVADHNGYRIIGQTYGR